MSDHIPDATKMISDTPRTDSWKRINDPIEDLAAFARQLERELNAMTRDRDIELERATHYRDKWQSAEERIKRLEEALESIREYWNRDNNNRAMIDACWYAIDTASEALEAKEAKP